MLITKQNRPSLALCYKRVILYTYIYAINVKMKTLCCTQCTWGAAHMVRCQMVWSVPSLTISNISRAGLNRRRFILIDTPRLKREKKSFSHWMMQFGKICIATFVPTSTLYIFCITCLYTCTIVQHVLCSSIL